MRVPVLALLLLLTTTLSQANDLPRLEFKGVYVGMKTADLSNSWSCQFKKTKFSDTVCSLSLKETIAGAPAIFGLIYAYDYTADRIFISFKSSDYTQIKLALMEKYGPGAIVDSEVANRMGAKFDNQTITWVNQSDVMTLEKRSGKVDEGALTIRSVKSLQEFKERMLNESKSNAKDL